MAPDDTAPAARSHRLVPFRSLPGHRLAEGEPDIHGWPLVDVDGRAVGVVDELLVDPATAEVESVLATLAPQVRGDRAGQVLVPMPRLQPDPAGRAVLSDLDADALRSLPRVRDEPGPNATATSANDGAEAARRAGAAAAPTGAAGGGSTEVSTGATPIPTHTTIERTADGEEVVRVPIVEEELVVTRRAVVKEVLVLRKRAVTEQRVVEADLRRERVVVDRRDAPPTDGADASRRRE